MDQSPQRSRQLLIRANPTMLSAPMQPQVALDLAVHALPNVYTLMAPSLDAHGKLINPVRVDWIKGGVFITPPGWWHSHHNESEEMAWVLPMQDAGLYTYQRTLDIRFVDEEVRNAKNGMVWGSSFTLKRKERKESYQDLRDERRNSTNELDETATKEAKAKV